MSASIRIESGIAAGTSYWIDRPVLRVGSDPQCEICLPTAELAPHALTIEFRNGAYRAYNRSTIPISVGRTVVQPGAAGEWNADNFLTLPGDVKLVLSVDGDPRPAPRPDVVAEDNYAEVEPRAATVGPVTSATTKGRSKSLIQMAVIAFCLLGMGGLLLISRSGGFDPQPVKNRPSFDAIVRSSLKKDEAIRSLVQKLQFSQSFIIRGHNEYAKYCFSDLRDQLVRQMDSLPEADRKDAEVIRDYVELQLGQLQ